MANTEHRDYPLPDPSASVAEEFWRLLLQVLPMIDADVAALVAAVASKAAAGHVHGIADVEGLANALADKMPANAVITFAGLRDVKGFAEAPDLHIPVKVDNSILMMAASAAIGAHGHALATVELDGFMGKADKAKLDGIAAGAQVNPGVATVLVPGLMGANDKLKLNGIQEGAQVNPGLATTAANGLLSSGDKIKLNGIATGATANSSDAFLRDLANSTGDLPEARLVSPAAGSTVVAQGGGAASSTSTVVSAGRFAVLRAGTVTMYATHAVSGAGTATMTFRKNGVSVGNWNLSSTGGSNSANRSVNVAVTVGDILEIDGSNISGSTSLTITNASIRASTLAAHAVRID